MPIHALCPSCGTEYNLPDQQAGKKVRCKQCRDAFKVVPAPVAEEVEEFVEAEVVEAVESVEAVEAVEAVEVVEAPKPKSRSVTPAPRVPPAILRDSTPGKPARGPSTPLPRAASKAVTREKDYGPMSLRDLEDLDDVERPSAKERLDRPSAKLSPDQPAKSMMPLIIGGAVAGALLLGGVITAAVWLIGSSPDDAKVAVNNPPTVQNPPVFKPQENKPPDFKQPDQKPLDNKKPPEIQALPEIKPLEIKAPPVTETKPPVETRPGTPRRDLSEDPAVVNKVKRATVYIEVKDSYGRGWSGTGFLGVSEARNLVLTNAHVVGMLAPGSQRPQMVKVFINNGQPDEKALEARVLGVDQAADLAVLDVGNVEGMPEPLTVATSDTLNELQKLWVFGFPGGASLGREITIRPTDVSSFRKKNGILDKIQVNGGMDKGNSGGPVVDANGQVVGVSVSGIPGKMINFAIPGEHILGILKGRVSTLTIGQSFYGDGGKVGVPVTVNMLDPRNQVKQVSLEFWTGDTKPDSRPLVKGTAPASLPGDTERQKIPLKYLDRQASGDVTLPDLPSGKTYWFQPSWVNLNGETQWAPARPFKLDANAPPVERKAVALAVRNAQTSRARVLTLGTTASFRAGTDDDTEAASMTNKVTFHEKVQSGDGAGGAILDLQYGSAERFFLFGKDQKRPSRLVDELKPLFSSMHVMLRMDTLGNVSNTQLDKNKLAKATPEQMAKAEVFHAPTAACLNALSVTMPKKRPGDTTAPGEAWTSSPRSLPIETPGKFSTGSLETTYTYIGTRKHSGRDEAVIAIDGVVQGKAGDAIGGRASGTAYLDLGSQQITSVQTRVTLDMDAVLSEPGEPPQIMHVLAVFEFSLKRQ